ncbi:MAG: hypothetical protein B7Z53_04270, partial [Rhodospirillales bacterium 12-71-4]
MDDLLAEFLAETTEAVADLDTALVVLERQGGDAETLARIFRAVHSVKGAAGFLGLHRLGAVAHAAENLLGLYRDGEAPVTPAGVTAVLTSLDCIRAILDGLRETGAEPEGDDAALVMALDAAAMPVGCASEDGAAATALAGDEVVADHAAEEDPIEEDDQVLMAGEEALAPPPAAPEAAAPDAAAPEDPATGTA